MKVIVEANPQWISEMPAGMIEDDEFKAIFIFFVLNTPCSELSSRARTIRSHGWTAPWRKPFYLNRQLKQQASNYNILFSASKYDELDDALQKCHLSQFPPENIADERISFYDNKNNQFMSVFYHLRNSLAHGRFNTMQSGNDWVFILEDVAPYKNQQKKVSARMIIRKSTLLSWIELITNGEKEYVKEGTITET